MNRKARVFLTEAIALESKVLLSVANAPVASAAEVSLLTDRHAKAAAQPSANTIKGRYFAQEDNRAADAPLHVQLDGIGQFAGLGRVKSSGALDLGGFRMADTPDITGSLTLSNARGSVKISLNGFGGFADVPNGKFMLNGSITSGTGAFKNFRRVGIVTVQFGENQIRAIKAPSPIGGPMTISLRLKPPVR